MVSAVADDGVTPVGWSGSVPASGRRASRSGSRQTATPAELTSMLAKLAGGSSLLLALWVGSEEVAMTSEESQAVAEPAARMLARTKIAKRMAKQLAGASDGIDLAFALALYGLRISPYVSQKVANRARPIDSSPVRQTAAGDQPAGHHAASGVGSGASPGASPNGHVAGGYGAYTDPPESGAGLDYGSGIRPIW